MMMKTKDNNINQSGRAAYRLDELAQHSCETDTIEELTSNPLKCGFLLAFCESEFSAENMRFIVEIDRFRDYYLAVDHDSWCLNLNWKDIDAMLGIDHYDELEESDLKRIHDDESLVVGGEESWPSKKILFLNSVEHIQKIWNSYLSPKAPHQICIPSRVLINTKTRLRNLHLYGGFVFEETMIDPLKTLKRDTLPRFLTSEYYKKMQKRLDLVYPLPEASDLSLALPSSCPTALKPKEMITLEYLSNIPLAHMLHDKVLYSEFLGFCKRGFLEENLYCARAISIFKSHYKSHYKTCPPQAEDMAWTIFRYFIAPKAVYEVSLSHRRKKEFMQALANPSRNMFDKVDKSVVQILKGHWSNYTKSSGFQNLPRLISEEKEMTETLTGTMPSLTMPTSTIEKEKLMENTKNNRNHHSSNNSNHHNSNNQNMNVTGCFPFITSK